MNKLSDLTTDEIIIAIKTAETLVDVCRKLNVNDSGGNKRTLRNFIKNNNIDTSHFKRNLTREQYEQTPKLCKNCGKVIDWEHRENEFCSHSCSATYNNRNRQWSEESRKKLSETIQKKSPNFNGILKPTHFTKNNDIDTECNKRICKNCGKPLTKTQKFYCCLDCQHEYQTNEYLSRWKNGEETGLSGEYGLNKRIRNYLLNKVNYKCELCGWSKTNPFTGTIPLEIHHKDGDYTNNKEENLQVLCPNCHSLTETYKSHNKEGRKSRGKYYSNE